MVDSEVEDGDRVAAEAASQAGADRAEAVVLGIRKASAMQLTKNSPQHCTEDCFFIHYIA